MMHFIHCHSYLIMSVSSTFHFTSIKHIQHHNQNINSNFYPNRIGPGLKYSMPVLNGFQYFRKYQFESNNFQTGIKQCLMPILINVLCPFYNKLNTNTYFAIFMGLSWMGNMEVDIRMW